MFSFKEGCGGTRRTIVATKAHSEQPLREVWADDDIFIAKQLTTGDDGSQVRAVRTVEDVITAPACSSRSVSFRARERTTRKRGAPCGGGGGLVSM